MAEMKNIAENFNSWLNQTKKRDLKGRSLKTEDFKSIQTLSAFGFIHIQRNHW